MWDAWRYVAVVEEGQAGDTCRVGRGSEKEKLKRQMNIKIRPRDDFRTNDESERQMEKLKRLIHNQTVIIGGDTVHR